MSNTSPANIPVSGTGAWWMAVWAHYSNANLGGRGAVMAGWRRTDEATGPMRMLVNSESFRKLTFWGSNADYFGGSYPAANAWHQFTITREANAEQQVSIYVNGVGAATSIVAHELTDITSTPTVWVGGFTGWNPTVRFTGAIDDMAIWNEALSAGQVGAMRWSSPSLRKAAVAGWSRESKPAALDELIAAARSPGC